MNSFRCRPILFSQLDFVLKEKERAVKKQLLISQILKTIPGSTMQSRLGIKNHMDGHIGAQ